MIKLSNEPYLVRFGIDAASTTSDMRIEFVAKAQAWSYSATTDIHGDFHFLDQSDTERKLYSISQIALLQGFVDLNSVGLTDFTGSSPSYTYSFPTGAADIAPLQADLESVGHKLDYIVGAGSDSLVLVIRYGTGSGMGGNVTHWQLTASPSLSNSYGAAWNHKDVDGNDHLYFSANSGAGVYEMTDINLLTATCLMSRLGSSQVTGNNDGMNCLLSSLPFPSCGDKNGAISPNPNPVTDAECGPGYVFNTAAYSESCTTNPCSVGDASAADQSVCCISGSNHVWRASAKICTPLTVARQTQYAAYPSTLALSASAQSSSQATEEDFWDGSFV
jgi:hypothetical protein